MKRLIALMFMALCLTLAAEAQSGLSVGTLFTSMRGNPNVSVTCVKGRPLSKYRLSLFYSLAVEDDNAAKKQVEAALAKDARKAVDREVHYKDGRLYYAFYNMGQNDDGLNRYILYNSGTSKTKAVLIYLEGKAGPEMIDSFLK